MSQKNFALCPKTATAATAELTSRNRNAVLPMPDRLTGSSDSRFKLCCCTNSAVALWIDHGSNLVSSRGGCVSILSQTSLSISGGLPLRPESVGHHTHTLPPHTRLSPSTDRASSYPQTGTCKLRWARCVEDRARLRSAFG
jgi:hypothetical protein